MHNPGWAGRDVAVGLGTARERTVDEVLALLADVDARATWDRSELGQCGKGREDSHLS